MATIRELAKQANVVDPRVDFAKQLISTGLAGLGVGAAARGLVGFRNLNRAPTAVPFVSPGPSAISIPVPAEEEEENPEDTAQEEAAMKFAEAPGLYDQAAQGLAKALPQGQWWRDAASVPGTVLTGAAGLMGGWQMTDWILDKRRKAQLQAELEAARDEYNQALMPAGAKTAAAEEDLGQLLDQLYDGLQKTAGFTSGAMGAYMLAAALVGGGAGYGTYKWTKDRSQAALLAKAQKERANRLWHSQLQPVFAVPKPVPTSQAA